MSEKSATNGGSPFQDNPFQKLFDEQLGRMASIYDEMMRLETEGVDRATTAIDEMAKLTKESIGYATKLSSEWRRLGLETTRRTAQFWSAGRL